MTATDSFGLLPKLQRAMERDATNEYGVTRPEIHDDDLAAAGDEHRDAKEVTR